MHLLRSRSAALPLLPVPSQLVLHGFSVHGVYPGLCLVAWVLFWPLSSLD